MSIQLRILILEDHAPDAELMLAELRRSGFDPQWTRVASAPEFHAHLSQKWDMILADFALPQFNALDALEVLRDRGVDTPLIVVTGAVGEEVAVECIKQGAADYLLKDRLTRLASAVRQALERRRIREESVLAHRALIESEQRFRALIEHSSSGMLLLHSSGQVMHCYHDLFTGGDDSGCGDSFLEWMLPEDRPAVRKAWDCLPRGIQTTQFRISNGRGGVHWLEATCHDLRYTPCVGAIVVHYRDVTERRQLEEQFRQAQKMEAVGQLAAGLAHDFNNLLTIMGGYSDVLLRHPDLSKPVRKGLTEIQDACRRATRLTRELLTFSRKYVSRPEVLDLNHAVKEIAPLLESLLGENVTLRLNLPSGVNRVLLGEGELEQTIMNLAVNARDAMGGSGVLTVETRNVENHAENHAENDAENDAENQNPASPAHTALKSVPRVMLSVTDTGRGMDAGTQARIFEPFFTTKDVGQGTGLGLSTVYAIVTNAGGEIFVESEEGKGTTFRVLFPSTQAAPTIDRPGAPTPARKAANETILLVEDDDQIRALISSILEPLGYRLLAAGNAAEAVERSRFPPAPIDLLLTDVRMPGVKGTELAQLLRKECPGLKVLFISGGTGMDAAAEEEGLKAAYLLPKPFTPDVLIRTVRHVLDSARAHQFILIVDDDTQIRNFLRVVLEAEGYAVEEAADGGLALAMMKRHCPDVVITDIVMPNTEGIELILMMRQVSANIKIIAMSGAAGRESYLEAATMLGADAAVSKPLEIDVLLTKLRELLQTRGDRAPAKSSQPVAT